MTFDPDLFGWAQLIKYKQTAKFYFIVYLEPEFYINMYDCCRAYFFQFNYFKNCEFQTKIFEFKFSVLSFKPTFSQF
jgi:hypothetical protein